MASRRISLMVLTLTLLVLLGSIVFCVGVALSQHSLLWGMLAGVFALQANKTGRLIANYL